MPIYHLIEDRERENSEWKNSAHSYQNTFEIEFIAHLKINIKWHDTHLSPVAKEIKPKISPYKILAPSV